MANNAAVTAQRDTEEANMETIADLDEIAKVVAYLSKRVANRRAALVASNQQTTRNGFRS